MTKFFYTNTEIKNSDQINTGLRLPKKQWHDITKIFPTVCADVIIRNTEKEILLSWRDDKIFGKGWHVPGGTLAYKQSFSNLLGKIIKSELDLDTAKLHKFIGVYEYIHENIPLRSHAITLVFETKLLNEYSKQNFYDQNSKKKPEKNQWSWFNKMPKNILETHKRYESFFIPKSD